MNKCILNAPAIIRQLCIEDKKNKITKKKKTIN